MNNDLVLGTQYLRGCSPQQKEWERDLKNIAALGFNTIRVWLVWGVIEPVPGKIDFPAIDRILDLAEANQLRVIFLLHLHSAPEWLCNQYKQYWYVNRHGEAFHPSARANSPSGGWPGLCPDNPEVQKMEADLIRRLVSHIGDRAYAYEPINEPHMWVDLLRDKDREFCYCEATQAAFRRWLKQKYGTIKNLNAAWGRLFDKWENVTPNTWGFGYADKVDFRDFTTDNIAALVARRTAEIRKYTTRPVIAHAWGGGTLQCAQLGAMAFDDWRNAAQVDAWGCSGFPDKAEDTANLGFCMDAARSAANGKTFWQSELSAGENGLGFNIAPVSPELLVLWCLESLFHGAKGLLFWQYRKEIYGNECDCFALTDRAGNPNPRVLAFAELAKALRKHERDFMASQPDRAEAALVFHYRSAMLDWAVNNNNERFTDALSGYYKAFHDRNIPLDVVSLREPDITLQQLAAYKLLILPAAYLLDEHSAELLTAYVKQGGTLLADPLTGSWDDNCQLNPAMPGFGLDKVFGAAECYRTAPFAGPVKFFRGGTPVTFRDPEQLELFRISGKAAAFLATEDGRCAVSENRFGKGKAYLAGIPLGTLNSLKRSIGDDFVRHTELAGTAAAASLINEIAAGAGITLPFGDTGILRVRRMQSTHAEFLLIANPTEQPFTGSLKILEAEKYTILFAMGSGKAKNGNIMQLTMPPCGSILLYRKR